jgi:hypothetical protein
MYPSKKGKTVKIKIIKWYLGKYTTANIVLRANLETGCIERINGRINTYGYPVAFSSKLFGDETLHRIVYRVFKGDILPGNVIRHTCDNPKCINPDHLLQGTHADNVADRVARGRSAIGEQNGRSKLTNQQVIRIKNRILRSNGEFARMYNVDRKVIYQIRHNKTWTHIKGWYN